MRLNPIRKFTTQPNSINSGPIIINDIYTIEDLPQDLQNDILSSIDIQTGTDVRTVGPRKFSTKGWVSSKESTEAGNEIVFQFKFAREHLINWISFSLLAVPQTWSIYYYDYNQRTMLPLYNKKDTIQGNVSGVVAEFNFDDAGWTRISRNSNRIRTNLIEFRIKRTSNSTEPYSLGLRNVSFAMNNDNLAPTDIEEVVPTGFGPTENITFYHYEGYNAIDPGDSGIPLYTYWKSSPQAVSASVQSLLVDIRDDQGNAQVFDTIGMLPITLGPRMSISYSNDEIISEFTTSNTNFAFSSNSPDNTWTLDSGYEVVSNGVYSIRNKVVRFDPSKNWTVAAEWEPNYTETTGQQCIWSAGRMDEATPTSLSLVFDVVSTVASPQSMTGVLKLLYNTSVVYTSPSITVNPKKYYTAMITYTRDLLTQNGITVTPNITLRFAEMETDTILEDVLDVTLEEFWPTDIFICNNYYLYALQGKLRRFWIRQGVINNFVASSFISNPDPFIWGEGNLGALTNGYNNALLVGRFVDSEVVKAGPGAGYFREKQWTPILQDCILNNKYYPIGHTIKAKFIKFEFTAGPGSYYDANVHTTHTQYEVTTYPQWIYNLYKSYGIIGNTDFTNPARAYSPFERPVNLQIRPPQDMKDISDALAGAGRTERQIVHDDMLTVDYWQNRDEYTNYNTIQEAVDESILPVSNPLVARTTYSSYTIPAERDRAFFISIGALKFFRTNLKAVPDAPEYVDDFNDCLYICQYGSFVQHDGYIKSERPGTGGFDRNSAVCDTCDEEEVPEEDLTTWWTAGTEFEL